MTLDHHQLRLSTKFQQYPYQNQLDTTHFGVNLMLITWMEQVSLQFVLCLANSSLMIFKRLWELRCQLAWLTRAGEELLLKLGHHLRYDKGNPLFNWRIICCCRIEESSIINIILICDIPTYSSSYIVNCADKYKLQICQYQEGTL